LRLAFGSTAFLSKGKEVGTFSHQSATPPLLLRQLRSAFCGALTGLSPIAVSMLMSPAHRSPYLLAYPAVIFSAWVWGLPGSLGAAVVAGACTEHFIFGTRQIDLSPIPHGWLFRESAFVFGSIFVGVLTRSAALQRERSATANLTQKLALANAERMMTAERERAAELALENEVRTSMALDGANAGVFEWDLATQRSRWSSGFYRVHGLPPGSDPSLDAWRSRIHPEDADRVDAEIRRAIAEFGAFSAEYRVIMPNGTVRWIESQGKCMPAERGAGVRVSGYCGDVTRRKLADFALLQNEKLAVAGRLSASIAHEVNNPLEAAMNLVYLAGQSAADSEVREYLGEATQQLERVSQITHQTLLFSRSTTRMSSCRPSTLLEATLRLLGPKLRMAGVEVATEIRYDPDFACSSGQLQQVFTNVLNNAVEALDANGRIRIRVSRAKSWSRNGLEGLRITIADTGSGMSLDTLSRMREPFFTTKEGTGTGLGMWVVFELIEKQRGTVRVRSRMGAECHGTAISIFLPV
jgi:signal transduction histidine kinase